MGASSAHRTADRDANRLKGQRKFILTAGTIVMSTVLVAMGVVSDTVYREIVIAALGIFGAANYGEHREEGKRGKDNA